MFSSALKSLSSNISSNYTISSQPTASAGAWKVFDARHKKSAKAVSVFVFDRKSLEPVLSGGSPFRNRNDGGSRRKLHDEVVERLKKEAASLARLRHPNILELAEPVEDTRNGGLIFATEPIVSTVAGLLDKPEGTTRGRSPSGSQWGAQEQDGAPAALDDMEMQKGLLQVAKGLEFLHESAGLVHGNLTPDAIFVNQKSDWKLSGLAFSGPPDASASGSTTSTPPIALSELLHYDARLPRSVQLNLDYSSPDFVMDAHISSAADMFSLGLVIISLYNRPHESPIHSNGAVAVYKKLFSSSSTVPTANNNFLSSQKLPRPLVEHVLPRLITRKGAQRMTAREFQTSKFFDNVLVSAIRFLDDLPAKTPNEKLQFMRGLPRVLDQFPRSVLERKLLPALLEETKDRELLAIILGNVFKITALLETAQRSFADRVLPKLREIFLSSPARNSQPDRDPTKEAGLVIILDHMSLVVQNTPGERFKEDVLALVQLGLESPTHAIVGKALDCIPAMLASLSFSIIKNDLFPAVAHVFSKTSSLGIKVKCLDAFVILCGGSAEGAPNDTSVALDRYTVQDKMMPLLRAMKTKEPAVMMAALRLLRKIADIVELDFIALELMPVLWTFALGPLLNLQQFNEFMGLIKLLSARIESEQTRKLNDLAATSANGIDVGSDLLSARDLQNPFATASDNTATDFERLVLGGASASDATSPMPTETLMASRTAQPLSPPNAWRSSVGNDASISWQSSVSNSTSNILPGTSQAASWGLSNGTGPPSTQSTPALQPSNAPNPWASPRGVTSPSQTGGTGSNPWASPTSQSGGPSAMPNLWQSPPTGSFASSGGAPNLASAFSFNPTAAPMGSLAAPLQPQQRVHSNSFTVASPPSQKPANTVQRPTTGTTTNAGAKSGLDAYESLI